MSVIQKIRDKYARWAVIAIGLSLLGFIMMDAFGPGGSGMFGDGGPGNTLGKVNGEKIEYLQFAQEMQNQENMYRQQGYTIDENQRQQLMSSLWEQEVMSIIMKEEYEKLGLVVTDREIRQGLLSNPPDWLKQRHSDENGQFNTASATQEINTIMRDNKQKEQLRQFLLMRKYAAMLTQTVHVPQWLLEKKNADNSLIASISYVHVPYISLPDSSFKVTDKEIKAYLEDHEDEFKVKEETRSIEFVSISAAPTSQDSAAILNGLTELKDSFSRVNKDYDLFLQANNSTMPFYNGYLSGKAIQNAQKDSFTNIPVGSVYGPYLDVNQQTGKGVYVLAKMIDRKQWADTAKVRHILIATMQRDQQSGQMYPVREDSSARRTADSVLARIKAGDNFDSLVVKLSDDGGSKATGGVYENISANGQWAEEFVEFSFNNNPGAMGVVKTVFGYHVMEVMSHKGSGPAYKIAYLGREILPSDETEREAANLANQFAGESRDLKSFNANYDKMLRSKMVLKSSATLRPLEYFIPGINGNARTVVRKIYEEDKGDVIGPELVEDNYIVAVITDVSKPGLPSVESVRSRVEPVLIQKKKAEKLVKDMGTVSNLEQLAAKMQQQVYNVDSLRMENPRALGYEPKVIGAAFNPNNKNKVVAEPIAGAQGVYAIRVNSQGTTPVEQSIEGQRQLMESQEKQLLDPQYGGAAFQALRDASNIKDYRYKFY